MHRNNAIPHPAMGMKMGMAAPPGIIANTAIPQPSNEPPKKRKWYQKIGDGLKKAWNWVKGAAGTVMNIPGVSNVIQGVLPGVINKGKDLAQQGIQAATGLANRITGGKLSGQIDPLNAYLKKKIDAVQAPSVEDIKKAVAK